MTFKLCMCRWAVANFFQEHLVGFDAATAVASDDENEALASVVQECVRSIGGLLQVEEDLLEPSEFLGAYIDSIVEDPA